MISDMIDDMAVVDSEGAGGLHCPPLGQYIKKYFITHHSCFENTL